VSYGVAGLIIAYLATAYSASNIWVVGEQMFRRVSRGDDDASDSTEWSTSNFYLLPQDLGVVE
jgi:hypothetical protein